MQLVLQRTAAAHVSLIPFSRPNTVLKVQVTEVGDLVSPLCYPHCTGTRGSRPRGMQIQVQCTVHIHVHTSRWWVLYLQEDGVVLGSGGNDVERLQLLVQLQLTLHELLGEVRELDPHLLVPEDLQRGPVQGGQRGRVGRENALMEHCCIL